MADEVLLEKRGAVLTVTFNRPAHGNALTVLMAQTLKEKLRSIQDDRTARVVLLRGAGGNFMSGHDLSAYSGDVNAVQDVVFQKTQFFSAIIRGFHEMEKPIVAALDGYVAGAGFSLMLASDMVLATKRTVFNTGFLPHAMVPDGGATFYLPRKVGALRAIELLLLSEDFSTEAAERWGLINRTVENDALETEALALAEKLSMIPTRVAGETKKLVGKSYEDDLSSQLALEATAWTAGSKTFDFREAVKARAEKRTAKYTGA